MSLAAPDSEVDICNLALSHVKQRPVVQIDPPTSAAENLCAVWYHQVRRATLRGHVWNFALKRVKLTPDPSAVPLFGFTHAYLKPSDWVRFIGRYDDLGSKIVPDDYELEGNYYYTNGEDSQSINIRYIYDHVHVSKFDPLFISLFAINLAIILAPNFSGTENRVKVLVELQKEIKAEATAIDGQERPPRRIQKSKFITARRQGRTVAGPNLFFKD